MSFKLYQLVLLNDFTTFLDLIYIYNKINNKISVYFLYKYECKPCTQLLLVYYEKRGRYANLKTRLLLGAQLLQNSPLVRTCLEVALVACELYPGVPLLLVGLKERCPLHDVTKFAPSF